MSKCERYRQWMHDAVDGDLASERVEQLDGHLASCSECRRQMLDLQALVSAASELPKGIEPKRDLWPEIEGRLVEVKTPRVSLAHVGLAVAAMVIIGVALSVLMTPESKPQFLPADRSGVVLADHQTATLDGVRLEYREARAELLEVVQGRSQEISPETQKIIDNNLALIDRAIDEIETVLADNPGEGRLDRHLYLAYARQIELLRWAARMPSQT